MATKTKKESKGNSKFDYKTIKTFEDACVKCNLDPKELPEVSSLPEEFQKAIIAAYKLMIIFKAINNGWKPDWSNWDQYKYFPWFRVLSSGFGFADSYYGYTITVTSVGSRLCFQDKERSDYAAKQFIDLYKSFLT